MPLPPAMILRLLQGHALSNPYRPTSKLLRIALPCLRQHRFRRSSTQTPTPTDTVQRHFIPPPSESSGPLLSRLPNRSLPSVKRSYTWLKTLPAFIIVITLSSLAIFNYQKSSSSTVNSILYALRTNEMAREVLGDEIYFASKVPWIRGELNPMQGRIDISFWVKGGHGRGRVRFVSMRKKRDKYFQTLEWSLETEDGKVIQLLDNRAGALDPFQKR